MEIKEVKNTKLYGKEIITTLASIGDHVKLLPDKVLSDLKQKGFSPEGPQVWIYKGADGNPDTEFDLLVGFPVAEEQIDVNITALERFKCATMMHKGDWSSLGQSYHKVIDELMQNGLNMTGECREIYHMVDFENSENNLTEIQIGIK